MVGCVILHLAVGTSIYKSRSKKHKKNTMGHFIAKREGTHSAFSWLYEETKPTLSN